MQKHTQPLHTEEIKLGITVVNLCTLHWHREDDAPKSSLCAALLLYVVSEQCLLLLWFGHGPAVAAMNRSVQQSDWPPPILSQH